VITRQAAEEASERIGAAAEEWRSRNPEVARALDALGIRTEDYDAGIRGQGTPTIVYTDTSAPVDSAGNPAR
jgi:hypothetical protein